MPPQPIFQGLGEGKAAASFPVAVALCFTSSFLACLSFCQHLQCDACFLFAFRVFLLCQPLVKGVCCKSCACLVQIKSLNVNTGKIPFLGQGTCRWGWRVTEDWSKGIQKAQAATENV